MDISEPSRRLAPPGRVTQLSLNRIGGSLSIVVRLKPEHGDEIVLRFLGARDVRFQSERTELLEIVQLFADDISTRGWESLRFRVTDGEGEFVTFFCQEIESPQDIADGQSDD